MKAWEKISAPSVPMWILLREDGNFVNPFVGHEGSGDAIFPWPCAKRPRCHICREPLMCLKVIEGDGSPEWFTSESGSLVILLCREHWYEEKCREARWVSKLATFHVHGTAGSGWLTTYVPRQDRPLAAGVHDDDVTEAYRAAGERFSIERLEDFMVYDGSKLGGVPYWIQDPKLPCGSGLFRRRKDWKFVGQFCGNQDIELGDSGLLYLWRDPASGALGTSVQCY